MNLESFKELLSRPSTKIFIFFVFLHVSYFYINSDYFRLLALENVLMALFNSFFATGITVFIADNVKGVLPTNYDF